MLQLWVMFSILAKTTKSNFKCCPNVTQTTYLIQHIFFFSSWRKWNICEYFNSWKMASLSKLLMFLINLSRLRNFLQYWKSKSQTVKQKNNQNKDWVSVIWYTHYSLVFDKNTGLPVLWLTLLRALDNF